MHLLVTMSPSHLAFTQNTPHSLALVYLSPVGLLVIKTLYQPSTAVFVVSYYSQYSSHSQYRYISTPTCIMIALSFLSILDCHPWYFSSIDHFTVADLVTWPMNDNEAGVDLVLIQTSLLYCANQVVLMLTSWHLHEKSREVCIKARSPPASLASMARQLSTQL